MEKAGRKQREDFAMTETKYIFPKQMQSVAALVFIAVLIVLLLILTVMVHMRNRKLKSTLEEQIAERRLLDKICADFTAVYYVELNTGFFEILHMNDGTNAKKMNLKQCDNFNYAADQYAVQYLYEKERKEFKDWISTRYLKEQLSRRSALPTITEANQIRISMNFLRRRQSKYTRTRNIFSHWWVSDILMISWKKKLRSRIS